MRGILRLLERGGSRKQARTVEPEPAAEPEAVTTPEPEPEAGPKPEPVLVLAPEPEPEPEPGVVPLVLRDTTPRRWNLWDLERLAEALDGGDAAAEERALLLLHLREFADASGELPVEFDPLIRDAFGDGLAGLAL